MLVHPSQAEPSTVHYVWRSQRPWHSQWSRNRSSCWILYTFPEWKQWLVARLKIRWKCLPVQKKKKKWILRSPTGSEITCFFCFPIRVRIRSKILYSNFLFIHYDAEVGIWFYIVKTAIQAEICVAKCLKCPEHFALRYSQIRTLFPTTNLCWQPFFAKLLRKIIIISESA